MFNANQGVKYYALCLRSFILIPIHGVKLCAHCYTWSEAFCSFLYME